MPEGYRRKLIEVAIPLDDINRESAREKAIRHGHPSTLHLWWARRPLASARAVLFCSLIDDPGEEGVPQGLLDRIDALAKPEMTLEEWEALDEAEQRRRRLFQFIALLVKWESTNNEGVLNTARELIRAAFPDGGPPPVLDPFCGGGSIPLEAQRLGLEAYGSDLNPVAVLITKALIEIPPRFADRPPVNPDHRVRTMGTSAEWRGAAGIQADVRWYGAWIREEAWKRIGRLYPKGSNGETVIAWLWARTVKCPNPACGADLPLVRSFWLSKKKGRESWIEPVVDRKKKAVSFEVRTGRAEEGTDSGTKPGATDFACPVCEGLTKTAYVREEGMAGRLSERALAVVTEGKRQRTYLSPQQSVTGYELTTDEEHRVEDARSRQLVGATPQHLTGGTCYGYGLTTWGALFTPRQLVALTTFSDLIGEARDLAQRHAIEAGLSASEPGFADGGTGAEAYADGIATYLAFALNRSADRGSTICTWDSSPKMEALRNTFARQALPMTWDFAEGNPFSESSGNWMNNVEWVALSIPQIPGSIPAGHVSQLDATAAISDVPGIVIATDPPYYDNIGYSDLSDFFYVWLRRTLGKVYPTIFATLLTPKAQELVATAYRFPGGKEEAEAHFESGFSQAFALVRQRATADVPVTVYYAYKQAVSDSGGRSSTGWEKMLSGLIREGFQVTSTWPMRTEMANRTIGSGTNALGSSIVLTCRPRLAGAPIATLREFTTALAAELPVALREMVGGFIAAVDLDQAVIGPGMAIFSRYTRVIEPNTGESMTVGRALQLISEAVGTFFGGIVGSLDRDTQFCVKWFELHGLDVGKYPEAEQLATVRNLVVDTLADHQLLESKHGSVRLYGVDDYIHRYVSHDPATDQHSSVWQACHYLAAALIDKDGGEAAAARIARRLGGLAHDAVALAYHLFAVCNAPNSKWSREGQAYNALTDAWPAIQVAMAEVAREERQQQGRLV